MDRSEAGKKGYKKTKHIHDAIRAEKSQQVRSEYETSPKSCLFCGKLIPYEKRRTNFCNQSCAASHRNQGVTRHIKRSKLCGCGNPKLPQNKFCPECIQRRVFQKLDDTAEIKSDKTRKKVLLEKRGQRCEGCGLTEWKNYPIPLDLHHVDGDSDNNLESNLQLLCPNCHAITDTHKRRNKNGKRQQERRQRYADGKTW